jgi:NAD+ kinase
MPKLVAGDYTVTERMMLDCRIEPVAGEARHLYALNELVVEKTIASRLIRIEVALNGSPFTTYAADGIIVATPTGSTAYSFSARGPIVSPRHRCVLITPVSPHMLFDRTLVLGPDEELSMCVMGDREPSLTVDGHEHGQLHVGDRVICRAAAKPLRIADLVPRDFHQILKTKFALADRVATT